MAKAPAKTGLRLEPAKATVIVGSGMPAEFSLVAPDDEVITGVSWIFRDADDKQVFPPAPNAKAKGYSGARATFGEFGVNVWAGDTASYSRLRLEGSITLQHDKTKAVRTAAVTADLTFGHAWGGMAKAWYPYPADWDLPWASPTDKRGQRALLLMWDVISQLPDEIRQSAGAMPIVRTSHTGSLFGKGEFAGAHIPFVHDAVQISDKLVLALENSAPDVMPADIRFATTVLHEITHAVTYAKATWNLHQNFASLRKYMRNAFLGPVGALPAGAAAVPVVTIALIKEFLVSPPDFVSGFAEAADWELANAWARAARLINPSHDLFDLINWLVRIPKHGLLDIAPLRPNLPTGFGPWGRPLGLRHRSSINRDMLQTLQTAILNLEYTIIPELDDEVKAATDPKVAGQKQKDLDAAKQRLATNQATLQKHGASSGFVSEYAAEDVLEDIAETFTWLVFGAKQLNAAQGRIYADLPLDTAAISRRQAYLVNEGVFPKKWSPLVIGQTYAGLEQHLHLENLTFEL